MLLPPPRPSTTSGANAFAWTVAFRTILTDDDVYEQAVEFGRRLGKVPVRADDPQLTARGVGAVEQPRRLAFGHGPLPDGSELELRSGPLEEELRALGADGVRSLLLEGGPTLATAFLAAGLVDKLLVFVAPVLAGVGPHAFGGLGDACRLSQCSSEAVGEDVLLTAYVHEP